jgi:hypothetical protein
MTDDLNPEDLDGFTLVPTLDDEYDTIGCTPDTLLFDEWADREEFDPITGKYAHTSTAGPSHAHGPKRPIGNPPTMSAPQRRDYLPSSVLFDSRERLELIDINSNWYPIGKDAGLFPLCHECGNQLVEDEGLARCCVCAFQVTRRRLLADSALDDAE